MFREGFKKRGGRRGVSDGSFSTKRKQKIKTKNTDLKHWILPNNQFQAYLFFPFLGSGSLFSLDPGMNGRSNFKVKGSLEKPSNKCQRNHIQNSFRGE